MPEQSFTSAEDDIIKNAFNFIINITSRMTYINSKIETNNNNTDLARINLRTYASYSRRYVTYIHTPTPTLNVVAPPTIITHVIKRKFNEMTEKQLDVYEKSALENIARRRLTLISDKANVPACRACGKDSTNSVIASCGHMFCVSCYCGRLTTVLSGYETSHKCPITTCNKCWDEPCNIHVMKPNSTIEECRNVIAN